MSGRLIRPSPISPLSTTCSLVRYPNLPLVQVKSGPSPGRHEKNRDGQRLEFVSGAVTPVKHDGVVARHARRGNVHCQMGIRSVDEPGRGSHARCPPERGGTHPTRSRRAREQHQGMLTTRRYLSVLSPASEAFGDAETAPSSFLLSPATRPGCAQIPHQWSIPFVFNFSTSMWTLHREGDEYRT